MSGLADENVGHNKGQKSDLESSQESISGMRPLDYSVLVSNLAPQYFT